MSLYHADLSIVDSDGEIDRFSGDPGEAVGWLYNSPAGKVLIDINEKYRPITNETGEKFLVSTHNGIGLEDQNGTHHPLTHIGEVVKFIRDHIRRNLF